MLIVYEIWLRFSTIAAAAFLAFMAIELPTQRVTKIIWCSLLVLALMWAINRNSWARGSHS